MKKVEEYPIFMAIIEEIGEDAKGKKTCDYEKTELASVSEEFKKFYKERPKKTGGLGIGLSICKAIIEFHKWTLEAHNNDIGGVTFRIIIPFRKGELK